MKQPFSILVDIVGVCNLHCPSCPRGRYVHSTGSPMKLDFFRALMEKAKRETYVTGVSLFNWTDSLLHPEVARFIECAKRESNVPVRLSTNLNCAAHLDALSLCPPDKIIVSVSGFTQETYRQTHKGGDIEEVKINLCRLSNCIRWDGWGTKVDVAWHRYATNLAEEYPMREFVGRLGFRFVPCNAIYMPMESVVGMERTYTNETINRLYEHPADGIAKRSHIHFKYCALRENNLAIDSQGMVGLCCATWSGPRWDYLTTPLAEIQRKKSLEELCSRCQNTGALAYASGHDGSLRRRLIDYAYNKPILRRLLPQIW